MTNNVFDVNCPNGADAGDAEEDEKKIKHAADLVDAYKLGEGRKHHSVGHFDSVKPACCTDPILGPDGYQQTVGSESGVSITFTYATSADPNYAGAPSDAFLVPAIFFEVLRVWKVFHTPAVGSGTILGKMGVTLKPKKDLSGFAFTTALDVETRTLPLLLDERDNVALRRDCHKKGTPEACCSASHRELGCAATNLKDLCSFSALGKTRHDAAVDPKNPDWVTCFRVVEDWAKFECHDKKTHEACTFDGSTEAQTLGEYCDWRVGQKRVPAVNSKADCEAEVTADKDPRRTSKAHDEWFDILDRNYKHHAKATGDGSGLYNSHAYKDALFGAVGAAVADLEKITLMAPLQLIEKTRDFNNEGISPEKEAKFKGYNVVAFEGGGSSIEYTTDDFGDGAAGIDGYVHTVSTLLFRYSKDWSNELSGNFEADIDITLVGVNLGMNLQTGYAATVAGSRKVTVHEEVTIEEDPSTMFHLEVRAVLPFSTTPSPAHRWWARPCRPRTTVPPRLLAAPRSRHSLCCAARHSPR